MAEASGYLALGGWEAMWEIVRPLETSTLYTGRRRRRKTDRLDLRDRVSGKEYCVLVYPK